MSNLYYKNLGVNDPESTESRVRSRLREIHDYFETTEKQLKKHIPKFTSRLEGGVWTLKDKVPHGIDPFHCENYYLDDELKQPVNPLNIDHVRREFVIGEPLENDVLYFLTMGKTFPLPLNFLGYLLADIHPKGVNEDDEEGPLSLLEAADRIEIEIEGYRKSLPFTSRLEKDGAILIQTELRPTQSTFTLPDNTHVLRRQKEALKTLGLSPQPHQLPILNLFRKVKWDFEWEHVEPVTIDHWYVLKDETRDGTKEQRDFVRKALGTPDFAILEGPPGSGKTTTLLELVAQAILQGKRILLVASTHVAIDNLLERLITEREGTERGSVTLKETCGIVPLRIGDEGDVLDPVRPYCINNIVRTEISRIRKALSPLVSSGNATRAQKEWLGVIERDNANKDFETFLIESANLVCGTSIGILKAPIIRQTRLGAALFDIVIVDEASKTTFSEFLVPALFGSRWIISGDIHQLSPYVDWEPILENLRTLNSFSPESSAWEQALCMGAFQAVSPQSRKGRSGTSLILCRNADVAENSYSCIRDQAMAMNTLNREMGNHYNDLVPACCSHAPGSDQEKLALFGANCIVTTYDTIRVIEPYLPPNLLMSKRDILELLGENFSMRMKFCGYEPVDGKIWEEELQWRVCRMHELKDNPEEYDKLSHDVEMLVPRWVYPNRQGSRSRADLCLDGIHSIRRIALPSIIELLVNGFEAGKRIREEGLAIFDGLHYRHEDQKVLDSRRVLLTYQHRMHPDISRFSHDVIYQGKALKNATGMLERRQWGFGETYSSAAVWVDCRPKKDEIGVGKSRYNLREVRVMKKELERFIGWARNHPNEKHPEGLWSVACLAFYKGQVRKIIDELHTISGQKEKKPYFIRQNDNVSVRIGTVDRFQGQEADLVLLSFVQSRQGKKRILGFLNFPNRVNVAITRARYQLVVIGDVTNFRGCHVPLLNALAEGCTAGDIELGKA